MNSKVLLGVGISSAIIIAIVVIAISSPENTSLLTDREIRELIQKEISKSSQITGIHAQTICKIIELYCSDQKSFYAILDSSDGYTKFRYSQDGMDYYFRILGDVGIGI
ncbi:MAG: hypothetical protein ACW9W4_10465 [Candidatus Nitrosopumilus sp. bin_7KS]